MKKARHNKIITGLPDTYGRGRIVGDYRRVALYGIDYLLEEKENDFANCGCGVMTDDVIRLREEIAEQKKAFKTSENCKRSNPVDVLWIFSSNQNSEWSCHEYRTCRYIP